MGTKKKADYMVDNGTDWDQMLFSTTAEQVGFTKSDGSETNLQDEVTALNSQIAKFLFAKNTIIDCNEQGDNFIASFSNFDGTGHAPEGEVRGILMTMVDSTYPNEGAQTTQIFFSFYNRIYIRTIWNSQSWGTWTIVV